MKHNIQWVPCLLVEQITTNGCTACFLERMAGHYDTAGQAMTVAQAAIRLRPDAIGCTAKRVVANTEHETQLKIQAVAA